MSNGGSLKKRIKILDIWVDALKMKEAIDRIETFLTCNRLHTIFAVNPEKNFSVPKNKILFNQFKKSDLLLPDGIGIVLAAKIIHGVRINRIPGVDFMMEICKIAEKNHKSIYIYGAAEEVNYNAEKKLKKLFPNLKVGGRTNGFIKEREMENLIREINNSSAEILFVALGSPAQELWIAKYGKQLINIKICQGIGGSLDALVGQVKRAPEIWKKLSIEWLYRLISQPKRINRQKVLPIFALLVILTRIKNDIAKAANSS